jgi:hypothetical protein
MSQQAKASQQVSMLTAEAMHQTTLMQCFNPLVAAVPASASGHRVIEIDGQQYLSNDTTNHLLVVLAAQKVSKKTHSLSPIDLAWDSFEESTSSTSFVTPSVKKVAKRPVTMSSNVLLKNNNGSDNEIVNVACCRTKKRKLVPLSASQSSEV